MSPQDSAWEVKAAATAARLGGKGPGGWLLAIGLALAIVVVAGAPATAADKGYKIAHRGYVDTDLQFSEIPGAFTMTAWVMPMPTGSLRLGRTKVGGVDRQFYGLIDDVAVYRRAMTLYEIEDLMHAPIDPGHADLVAGWTFDGGVSPSPLLARPLTSNLRALKVNLSSPPGAADAGLFDLPFLVSPSDVQRRLPFAKGQVWYVIQEFDAAEGSHNGLAAFCWDLVLARPLRQGGYDTSHTAFEKITAAAPGQMSFADEWNPLPEKNKVHVRVLPNETDVYLHLATGSVTEVFWNGTPPLFYPAPAPWPAVAQDAPLARIDPGENHLHYCTSAIGGQSIPTAFHQYETSPDGQQWTTVTIGMPRVHQYIRRAD